MSSFDTITVANPVALPGNSQKAPLIDTTYWNDTGPWAAASSTPAPGKSRGQLAGRRFTGSVSPTSQAITLTFEILTKPAGTTNAAFEADTTVAGTGGTGSMTVAAGATQTFDFRPATPDSRIYVTAGGTAPSALSSTLVIVTDRAV